MYSFGLKNFLSQFSHLSFCFQYLLLDILPVLFIFCEPHFIHLSLNSIILNPPLCCKSVTTVIAFPFFYCVSVFFLVLMEFTVYFEFSMTLAVVTHFVTTIIPSTIVMVKASMSTPKPITVRMSNAIAWIFCWIICISIVPMSVVASKKKRLANITLSIIFVILILDSPPVLFVQLSNG